MATFTQVENALVAIPQQIDLIRRGMVTSKAKITAARNELQNLQTQHADVIATIQGYVSPDSIEQDHVDKLNKIIAEYQSLQTAIEGAVTDLAGYAPEF